MSNAKHIFTDIGAYLDALAGDPGLAIVSKKMAAEALGLSRPAIDGRIKDGRLATVKIAAARHVLASALIEHRRGQEEVNARIRSYLGGVAADRGTVFYEPVMSLVGMSTRMPRDRELIGAILGDISRASYDETATEEAHGILLSVLVHRKTGGTTRPSPAFFDLARELGFEWDDDDAFVAQEMERVWKAYHGEERSAA
ncbi:hypothetical protein [Rubrimonas cliftonensis]|uniref:Uncharacterized protein n=1 Tax=Rubrimonas cliftonensis TaxID=89524 RepID=A0A1H4FZ50_9RHOB|nr:hypothetical protein [Rubrimonas cliftonensis]SEB02361.1 hypothetical protein SAMN05444370_13126 [Rubrimonas cliftonensis]